MQTEFEFTLPRGYIDAQGNLHRLGVMRLATARDELEPLNDPRVQQNEVYLSVLLLSRVVRQIGAIGVTPDVIEDLFSSDFAYLQEFYLRINATETIIDTQCPNCGTTFALDLSPQSL
jgi:hypothetical protein